MCVLVFVKAGNPLPSYKDLMAMHKANPHGMGFASKSVHYKGMNFVKFYTKLQFVPKDENIIIHFRYATHGSIGAKNCHPFKRGSMWFAHNGILDVTPQDDMTDSETAFRNILYPVAKKYGLNSNELRDSVEGIIGYSKFAFLDKEGNVTLFGRFQEYKGMLCSNLNWVHYTTTQHKYSRAWLSCL